MLAPPAPEPPPVAPTPLPPADPGLLRKIGAHQPIREAPAHLLRPLRRMRAAALWLGFGSVIATAVLVLLPWKPARVLLRRHEAEQDAAQRTLWGRLTSTWDGFSEGLKNASWPTPAPPKARSANVQNQPRPIAPPSRRATPRSLGEIGTAKTLSGSWDFGSWGTLELRQSNGSVEGVRTWFGPTEEVHGTVTESGDVVLEVGANCPTKLTGKVNRSFTQLPVIMRSMCGDYKNQKYTLTRKQQ